jgi:hypothetical protein
LLFDKQCFVFHFLGTFLNFCFAKTTTTSFSSRAPREQTTHARCQRHPPPPLGSLPSLSSPNLTRFVRRSRPSWSSSTVSRARRRQGLTVTTSNTQFTFVLVASPHQRCSLLCLSIPPTPEVAPREQLNSIASLTTHVERRRVGSGERGEGRCWGKKKKRFSFSFYHRVWGPLAAGQLAVRTPPHGAVSGPRGEDQRAAAGAARPDAFHIGPGGH